VCGSGGWLWCSSTRVCRHRSYLQRQSLTSSIAAVDAALSLSSDNSSTTSVHITDASLTNDVKVSKLHHLLKRRMQLRMLEDRIKIAVEDLIRKYRTKEESTGRPAAIQGMSDPTVKNSCYSATCITRDTSSVAGPCYSVLCRRAQEQAFSCKIHLPDKMQQDLCQLCDNLPNAEDERLADLSPVGKQDVSKSSPELEGKSKSTVDTVSSNCVHVKEQVVKDCTVSQDKTRCRDTTQELRMLTSLLQRHVCNGEIHLTEVLVSKIQSLLDTFADTQNPVCLCGAVKKSSQKKAEIPVAHDFRTRRGRQSVFVLTSSSLRHLARSGGILVTVPGFSSSVSMKTDFGWIYVSPRPLFYTAWKYRTATACNLSAIALQLRVLWCCIRWDDMSSDSTTVEDTNVGSGADVVTTTTILRRRDVGQDCLRSEYLVRRISAPTAVGEDWHGSNCITVICIRLLKIGESVIMCR